jgi:chromosome segregation ATPase
MTRTKEVEPGSDTMPDYKSPPTRLVHSLRKGYDNLRVRLKEAREKIKYYQIKTRDLEKSREQHKQALKTSESQIKQLEKENMSLKKQYEHLQEKLPKKK